MATSRRPFGATWWSAAWVRALEEAAAGNDTALRAGRAAARNGRVEHLELGVGWAKATVSDRSNRGVSVDLSLRVLSTSEWEQVVGAISQQAGHAAAILDGELSPEVVHDAQACDIRLLPSPADFRSDCPCPEWAEPCRHALALGYAVADVLDRDAFLLLQLRGITRSELMDMLRERRRPGGDAALDQGADAERSDSDPGQLGVPAATLWQERPLEAPLPPLPDAVAEALHHPPYRPVAPNPIDLDVSQALGLHPEGIDEVAADAVERAWAMLIDDVPSQLLIGAEADLARRVSLLDRRRADALARELGHHPERLDILSEAWRLGGAPAVEVVGEARAWVSDQNALAAGREALVELGHPQRSIALNYDGLRMKGDVLLVIGPDRRWYRLEPSGPRGLWSLAAPPAADIRELVDPEG